MVASPHSPMTSTDLREALSEMFDVDKNHGPLHRLEASKLVEVWSQAEARTETQQKVESTARARGLPVELPAGSRGNLMKTFQDKYGSSIPPKELPAQSYFEVLEEMVQDLCFSTPNHLPKWSPLTLRTNIVLQTRTVIRSKLQCFRWVFYSAKASPHVLNARRSRGFPCKVRSYCQRMADDEASLTRTMDP